MERLCVCVCSQGGGMLLRDWFVAYQIVDTEKLKYEKDVESYVEWQFRTARAFVPEFSGVRVCAAVCCLPGRMRSFLFPWQACSCQELVGTGTRAAHWALLTIIFTFESAAWKLLSIFSLSEPPDKRKGWQLCLSSESPRKHFFPLVNLLSCVGKNKGKRYGFRG